MKQVFKQALISVSDKTGLVEFAKGLSEQGTRLLSTGGSAKILREAGLSVVDVSEETQFPEVMGGRVKTLHPFIHMPILARPNHEEDNLLLKSHQLIATDLVVVNLYPFEESLKKQASFPEQIEQIDIGGPSLLRAAAKNFSRVTVVCDPADYSRVLLEPGSEESRQKLSAKVFKHTAAYDALIARFLGESLDEATGKLEGELRYGENPQQEARWFSTQEKGLHQAERIQGKELSYNNLLDVHSALACLREFDHPACVALKHNSPCGVSQNEDFSVAVREALKADPISVFGGVIAVNRPLQFEQAEAFSKIFLEVILAPGIDERARAHLAEKKNLRVLIWPDLLDRSESKKLRSIEGGILEQSGDRVENWPKTWKILGQQPDDLIRADLLLAWRVCAHLRSNAIALAGYQKTVGLGMGQVNRVDAVEQALARWKQFHPEVPSPVLASDAFFPFADSIEKAAEAGISWVIQPGGSMKDEQVFRRAEELGVNLVLTGRRHFLH